MQKTVWNHQDTKGTKKGALFLVPWCLGGKNPLSALWKTIENSIDRRRHAKRQLLCGVEAPLVAAERSGAAPSTLASSAVMVFLLVFRFFFLRDHRETKC
jgi:hypothetical protein